MLHLVKIQKPPIPELSFVLFGEEMGGRQSGRPITSDGKCFPICAHELVQSSLCYRAASICICRGECVCSFPHILRHRLTATTASYLSFDAATADVRGDSRLRYFTLLVVDQSEAIWSLPSAQICHDMQLWCQAAWFMEKIQNILLNECINSTLRL